MYITKKTLSQLKNSQEKMFLLCILN